ncbi:MAG: PAS domain-containing protein [Qipengyuania sp.]|nr:PAS domain-containing protein [Qipengyuania sp.]
MDSGFLDRYRTEAGDVLDAILTHSRDRIELLDRGGALEYVGASARNALGLADTGEAIGKPWRDFWPESERAALDAAVLAAADGTSARFDGATQDDAGREWLWEVTVSPVWGDGGEITHLLALSTDLTARREAARLDRQRWQHAEAQAGLAGDVARELRHRIKNQLAVVNAVTRLLARHTESARDLAGKLEEKLISLAQAQDLLAIRHDRPLTAPHALAEILNASGAGERVEAADIPEVAIPDESVQQLALLLGELQTNALKHGALRDERGSVRLSGSTEGKALTLRWEEDCSVEVAPVQSGHGGFQLIRRLGAAAGKLPSITWQPTGIVVEFHVRTAARAR